MTTPSTIEPTEAFGATPKKSSLTADLSAGDGAAATAGDSQSSGGLKRIWDEATGLIADFLRDARRSLRETPNSFLATRAFIAGFLAQLSVAIFINRTLAQMPQVFDAFSQAVPFGIALFCFAISLLVDRSLTARPASDAQEAKPVGSLLARMSNVFFRLRVSAARYRLALAATSGAVSLGFGVALIFFYHSVVVQVETDSGMQTIIFATPEPVWLSDWKDGIRDSGGSPISELVTFNFAEVQNGLRYDARHGIAGSKTILALLFTMVTMFATITFSLMFQRKDRIEELLESSLVG